MTRLAAWLGVALVAVLVVWLLAPVLAPFVIAAVMAYVLQPLVLRLQGLTLTVWAMPSTPCWRSWAWMCRWICAI